MSYERIKKLHPRIEDHIGCDVKLIPFNNNEKYPTDKDWVNKEYSIEDLMENQGNYGYQMGYNHEENGYSLSCIDIDGIKNEDGSKNKDSIEYLYGILKNGLQELPNFEFHKSPNGYHILFWNKGEKGKDIHTVSDQLIFPANCPIKELQNKSASKSIEVWSDRRQIVAVGSIVNNHLYELEDFGNHILESENPSSIALDLDSVNNLLKNIFKKNEFQIKKQIHTDTEIDADDGTLKELNKKEISEVTNLLTEAFTILHNSKHTDVLIPLSNYLSNCITLKSAKKIVANIIKREEVPFDSVEKFEHDFLREWDKGYRENIDKTGINTTRKKIEEARDYKIASRWHFNLARLVDRNYVYRFNSEHKDNTRILTCLNFKEHKMYNEEYRLNKEGEEKCISYCKNPVGFVVTEITRVESLLERVKKTFVPNYVTFGKQILKIGVQDVRGVKQTIGMQKENEFFDVKTNDSHLSRKQLDLIRSILDDFDTKSITPVIIDEYVPGLYIHPDTHELVRSKGDNGLININKEKPSVNNVKKALELMNKLYNFYKGNKDKLGVILRYCLTFPLGFIYRNNGMKIPHLYLYGASNTAKTNLSEIGASIWGNPSNMSIPGSATSSVYQFGRALESTANGLIINECDTLMQKKDTLEVLKNSYDTNYDLRRRYKDKVDGYTSIIFTSNTGVEQDDALVKRLQVIMFDVQERMNEDDVKLFNKTFNWHGKNNNDFSKYFKYVGDYITWFLHEHMEVLNLEIEDARDKIIEALEEYSTIKIGWMYEKYGTDLSSADTDANLKDEVRNAIITEVKPVLNQGVKTEILNNNLKEDDYDTIEPVSIWEIVKYKGIRGDFEYLQWDEEKGTVIITRAIRKYLENKQSVEVIVGVFNKKLTSPRLKTRQNPDGKKFSRIIQFTEEEFKDFINGN